MNPKFVHSMFFSFNDGLVPTIRSYTNSCKNVHRLRQLVGIKQEEYKMENDKTPLTLRS